MEISAFLATLKFVLKYVKFMLCYVILLFQNQTFQMNGYRNDIKLHNFQTGVNCSGTFYWFCLRKLIFADRE